MDYRKGLAHIDWETLLEALLVALAEVLAAALVEALVEALLQNPWVSTDNAY
ncbi:hypothetical protein JCM21531_3671 [Acetivibrio straminisolvens JCM 21531]|uniref:Uncharacterized protein n=1 Tax=Acetivibrio straminisolvens JCM 21531 TaxID=1294263 RepID=W4VA71_9FIRM|nr:hypothetical protein JCM21531_3671 [Acetivibrio straminisolvens JCM 21531]